MSTMVGKRGGAGFLPVASLVTDESVNDRAARLLKQAAKNGDAAETLYDNWSNSYDETLKNWNYPCPQESARFLKELLPDWAKLGDTPILDCGCGTGMTGEELKAVGFAQITGIDISQASLDVSKTKCAYVDLRKADLDQRLEFPDGSFVATLCIGTISYVPKIAEFLKEMARVTTPGGIVLWTNRADYWSDNHRACKSTCEKLVEDGVWENVLLSGEADYLPNNPIKEDRDLRIRYIGYRVLRAP